MKNSPKIIFLPVSDENRKIVEDFIVYHWNAADMVIRGVLYDLRKSDGMVAMTDGAIVGLITFFQDGDSLEIASLDSTIENVGIGTRLLEFAAAEARRKNLQKLRLVTTNDNLRAIGFYQRRGFDMVKINRNAMDLARKLKPGIPLIGENGIPLRHEIEFERKL